MDAARSHLNSPEDHRGLTKSEVLSWLKANQFDHAYQALERESAPEDRRDANSAEQGCERNADVNLSLQIELGSSVKEALSAYMQLAGKNSVYTLLEHWDPTFLSTYCTRKATGGSGLEPTALEKRIDELEGSCAHLRTHERELDTQLKQTVTIIAERLQALVTSVDPMRKDILLPLLRTVAAFGSSSSVRAASRHMMLALYKRPIAEQRLAIVQEWLRIARDATSRSLEQELIPELYSLVNAPVFERRLLALDCAAAVAPLLRQSPQVRYSLCQGLLRPLCEDDTSAVRRELPRCLSLLWGDAAANGAEEIRTTGSRGGAAVVRTSGTSNTATAAPAVASISPATRSLSSSQQAFVMELLVHLATDTTSRTVRQAAQTQLCEVLYPVFLRGGVLLTQFVPLLLTVIGMEVAQMLLQRKPSGRGSSAVESRRSVADETTSAVASALSLNNVLTLVQLVQAALRCVAAEVVHSREEEDRRGEQAPHGVPTNVALLATTYVQVVVPTAHNLLTPLLSRMRHSLPLAEEASGGMDSVQDPGTQLCGPLCALCAALASLVPLLGAQAWDDVTRFLKMSAKTCPPPSPSLGGGVLGRDESSSLAHATSQSPQELLRGRLLFAYAYFLLLSGDVVVLPHCVEPAPRPSAATATTTTTATPEASRRGGEDNDNNGAVPASLPVLTSRRIQQESLGFLAHQIRLESDKLTSPRSIAMTMCVHCIASLAPFAQESHEVSSGMTALIRFLVASPDPRLRLTAVVLVHDACAAITHERLKVTLLIEPLQPLLEDLQPSVQEAALTGILTVAIALTEPRAQEKTIRPVLRVADTAGCTSRFTCCVLMQWDQLMQRMPAEPREALLYPQLSALMDRLAEQYVERVSRGGAAPPPAAAAVATSGPDAPLHTRLAPTEDEAVARVSSGELQDRSVEQWESTMLILQALLHNILRCAVVTPTLVSRYLLPGIQQLASEGVMSACNANVRTRWHRLLKSYLTFTENNTSRFSSFATSPSAGNLLDRVKDELKKRL